MRGRLPSFTASALYIPNHSIKQLMLPLHPLPHLPDKILRPQHPDHRPKGEHINQKLRLVLPVTAEESRSAYKDIEAVMATQKDLTVPVKRLKTIGVVKG